jgi:hypothetical protein
MSQGTRYEVKPPLTLVEKTNYLFLGYQEWADHVCQACVRKRRRRRQKATLIGCAVLWALGLPAAIFALMHQQSVPAIIPGIIALPLLILSVPLGLALLFAGWQADGQILALQRNRDRLSQAGLPNAGPGRLGEGDAFVRGARATPARG